MLGSTILMQSAAGAEGGQQGSLLGSMLPMIIILGIMFFFMSRSNKKREKEAADMRDSVQVGDEIYTIGGIVGTVVKLEEETLLLESGADRSKVRVTRSAVHTNVTANERLAAKQEEEKAARQAAKQSKKDKK